MNADPDNIVRIERDMMRTYVKDLYEVFFDGIVLEKSGKVYKKEDPVTVAETTARASTTVKEEVKPQRKKYTPPREIIVPESMKEEIQEVKKTPVKKKVEPVEPKPTPAPTTVNREKVSKTTAIAAEVAELFKFPKTRELSDKLSSLPIASLAKGVSINEKILAINELFAGDANAYNDTIKKLDSLSDFEEATKWLADNVIPKYDWVNAKKSKKAKVFIKLVKRRYN